jgi:hypothetical protein
MARPRIGPYSAGENQALAKLRRRFWLTTAALYAAFLWIMFGLVPREIAAEPVAVSFANLMAHGVPMLDQLPKIPGYDPFLRFYYAVLWLISPAAGIAGWRLAVYPVKHDRYLRIKSPTRMLAWGLLFWCACLLLLACWPVAEGGAPSWRDQALVSNVFSIGFKGGFVLVACFFIGATLKVFRDRARIDREPFVKANL